MGSAVVEEIQLTERYSRILVFIIIDLSVPHRTTYAQKHFKNIVTLHCYIISYINI